MMPFQYWLVSSPKNIDFLLTMVGQVYVTDIKASMVGKEKIVAVEPVLLTDQAIWHPRAPSVVFKNNKYCMKWYNNEYFPNAGIDAKTASTVGIILQKPHINTKDDTHYMSLISELESRGAKVVPIYSGGLDFSGAVEKYLYDVNGKVVVDTVINLIGFALVGGPVSQDSDKASQVLKKLIKPYVCPVPLVFQSFEEWKSSEHGQE